MCPCKSRVARPHRAERKCLTCSRPSAGKLPMWREGHATDMQRHNVLATASSRRRLAANRPGGDWQASGSTNPLGQDNPRLPLISRQLPDLPFYNHTTYTCQGHAVDSLMVSPQTHRARLCERHSLTNPGTQFMAFKSANSFHAAGHGVLITTLPSLLAFVHPTACWGGGYGWWRRLSIVKTSPAN